MTKSKKTALKDKSSLNKAEWIYVFTKQHGEEIVKTFGFSENKVSELVAVLNLQVVMAGHIMQINARKAPTRSDKHKFVRTILQKRCDKLKEALEILKKYDITMIKQADSIESMMMKLLETAKKRSQKTITKEKYMAALSLSIMIGEIRKIYEIYTKKIAKSNIKHNGFKDRYSGEFLRFTAYILNTIKKYKNSEELFGYIPDTNIDDPYNNLGKTILNALKDREEDYLRWKREVVKH